MNLISYTDLDPIVYATAFIAQHTRYVLFDANDTPLVNFKVESKVAKNWKAIDHDKKIIATAYNRQAAIEAVKVKFKNWVREEKYTHVDPMSHALNATKTMLDKVNQKSGAQQYVGCLSVGKCYRHEIATIREYKGNRKKLVKPVYYNEVREYLLEHKAATPIKFYEADDFMSMAQWADQERVIVSSIDKDMLNFPGRKYIHKETLPEDERHVYITFDRGMRNFYSQLLSGDTSDNIPGLKGTKEKKGWGPKTAVTALDKCESLRECHEFVCEEYHKKYGERHSYTHWKFDLRVELENKFLNKDAFTPEEEIEYKDLQKDPQAQLTLLSSSQEIMEENGKLLWMLRRHDDPLWTCDFMLNEILEGKDG